MGEYVWFHDVSWHASYAIYFFVIGILAGLSFMSYGSWITPALRPLRDKAAHASALLPPLARQPDRKPFAAPVIGSSQSRRRQDTTHGIARHAPVALQCFWPTARSAL